MDDIVKERVSADGRRRVEFFRRPDGSFGYADLVWTQEATESFWRPVTSWSSRFDTLETALAEAEGRVSWLYREAHWPARDRPTVSVAPHAPDWLRCPYCEVNFSMRDADRWGGQRHLSCGQSIRVAPSADEEA